MNREAFVEKNSLHLITADNDIRKYFDNASVADRQLLERGLRDALERAYDKYAAEYFSKGAVDYLARGLRYAGAASDLIGTYAFWALGGAGFGFKGVGFLSKSLADLIENRRYEKHSHREGLEKVISKDGLAIAGEGLAERAAAYLPLGVGELADLARGTSKYDSKIIAHTIAYAKSEFVKKFGNYKSSNIIPISAFANPAYAEGYDVVEESDNIVKFPEAGVNRKAA